MRRLISTVGLSKEEWLKYRKTGLTGTDAGAIVGVNQYKSAFDIYQDKITNEMNFDDDEAMREGRDLEEYVARRFTEETGIKVRRANAIYQNKEHPIMLADFDRVIVGRKAGLECKTVSPYLADRWKDGDIPLNYQMQVQHYLAVSGYDSWYIAALILGKEFQIRKIERDDEMIKNLITIEEKFWNENVLKRILPDPDGSEAYSNLLSRLYKGNNEQVINLFGYDEILKRRVEIDGLMDRLSKEKNTIDQKIKLQMGEAAYAKSQCFNISWIPTEQNRMDTKRLKAEAPEIYKKYQNSIHVRRLMIKQIVAT